MKTSAAAAKSLQFCPTLCDPIDGSPPGSSVPGILQARTLECHFLLQCMKGKSESEVAQSCLTLSDPMDCSLPVSPSMGFSRQEYWSWVPLPSPIHTTTIHYKGTILDSWGWCTGTTQRDGMGREEGGGFRMGNTCIPVVDSF